MNILEEIESGIRIVSESGPKILYHGSKGGIRGEINPYGRKACDFGAGFYLGTNKWQTKTLVYGRKDFVPWSYDISVDLTDLRIVDISKLAWSLFVTLNRHPENFVEIEGFPEWMSSLCENADIIRGPIADDRLIPVMNIFFHGGCAVEALDMALSECSLGTQYALKTELACSRAKIVKGTRIADNDRIIEEHAKNFSAKGESAYRRAMDWRTRNVGRPLGALVEQIRQCLGMDFPVEERP